MSKEQEFRVGAFPPDFKERVMNALNEKRDIISAINDGKRDELIKAGKIVG